MVRSSGKYILAIDLGTSGPKTALVSIGGEVIDHAFEKNRLHLLPDGGAEQDPEEWWTTISNTAKTVISRSRIPSENILAVSCSTQWSGTVAVDQGGRHLGNAMIWLDSRGSRYIREITDGWLKIEGYNVRRLMRWLRLTGGVPGQSGKDPIAHILYLKYRCPDIYRNTYKFLEPKDYINLRLTGKFAAGFDSITLHWVTDNRKIDSIAYDDRLIRMAGIDREKLPELKRSVDILGPVKDEVADAWGLRRGTPVICGTPDVQAAAIGSGAVSDFAAHFYIGTSSWLTCHVPFKKTDILRGIASLPSAIPGRYFVANEQETAGACLTYLKDNLFFRKDELNAGDVQDVYGCFDRMAARVPAGSRGVIFTPWLYGERTPIDDHTVRAGFYNQSLDTTREDLVRAVFEGVALNGRWLLFCVEKFVGRKLDPIRLIGGGAVSDVWCQIFADIFNRTIHQVKAPILANVRGAGLLGALALGHTTVPEIADAVAVQKAYAPDPEHRELYDSRFRLFTRIYSRNKKIYQALNGHSSDKSLKN